MSNCKKITLKDVAEHSGVSVSSVSMILNKRSDVSFSEETIQNVLSSAQKLGYCTKKNAKTKTSVQSPKNIIAIFCPNISNAYYSTIAQSIEQAAHLKGFKTIIFTTFRDDKLEQEFIKEVLHMNLSGIIFTMMPEKPSFLERIAKKLPVITIGDKTSPLDLDVIETSNYTAGILMAEHLYELGHRHIAFLTTTIGPSLSLAMRFQRLRAIQDTYQKLSMGEPYEIIVKEKQVSPELERKNIFFRTRCRI